MPVVAAHNAADNLVALPGDQEQIGAGGYDIVRGFDQRVIRGDEGLWGTFELYAPETSLGRIFDWNDSSDSLRLLTFFDAATVSNKELLPGEPDNVSIASVGVGLRWTYNDFFRLRVDYGHPVMTHNAPGLDEGGRFHFGAVATF